ncbi:hypothetical protein DIPPA_02799 [Diplonema papillatum]|nr:hypothetical protein DIPPA_02799 [Diplonema papillatum]
MAYLDDIHAMSESLRGLKAVAEVTTDFANATDGGVNAGKSFFYATNADAPGTLTGRATMVKSHLAPLVVAIRAARQARRDRPPSAPEAPGRSKEGSVFLLEQAITDIGWTWPRFDILQEGTGRRREWTVVQNVEPLTKEERQRTARHNFQHELREASRTMRYKDVVKTRASPLGIEDGIDGGATRDLLEKGAITGYQQGLVRAVIANAVHTGKRWEQATCRFCDADVPEDEQHMWWDCVKWSDVRGAYPSVLARRPEMKPCMALCGVMPKDAMGLDFDECTELAAGCS